MIEIETPEHTGEAGDASESLTASVGRLQIRRSPDDPTLVRLEDMDDMLTGVTFGVDEIDEIVAALQAIRSIAL